MASFADLSTTRSSKQHKLQKIQKLVRWYRIDQALNKCLKRSKLGPTGYKPLQLFKALLLQNLYNLSDPQLEENLYDRISFRDFCGFSMSGSIPDETTFCKFRASLQKHTEILMEKVNQELARHGVAFKSGVIIDATIVESSVQAPCGGQVSMNDTEAGWTKKGKTYRYGYKAHVSCDKESGLIKRVIATSADVHDSQVFKQLLSEDDPSAMADKAYGCAENRQFLEECGLTDELMYKAVRGKPLKNWQKWLNKIWSRKRGRVEAIFGTWKRGMGLSRCRYKGWNRNQVHFDLLSMIFNLNRCVGLLKEA